MAGFGPSFQRWELVFFFEVDLPSWRRGCCSLLECGSSFLGLGWVFLRRLGLLGAVLGHSFRHVGVVSLVRPHRLVAIEGRGWPQQETVLDSVFAVYVRFLVLVLRKTKCFQRLPAFAAESNLAVAFSAFTDGLCVTVGMNRGVF